MRKILLAEDDSNLNFVINDHLTQAGFDVTSCKNGQEAMEVFSPRQFDIVILDVMMPKTDGFNVALNIRKLDEFVPIIFLTARSQEEDRLKGFEVGGDDYVTKPFSMQELIYRVNVFLRRSESKSILPESEQSISKHTSFDKTNLILKVKDASYHLTEMEGRLFQMLIDQKNNLVKRSNILIEIWGEDDYFKGRSLDVFVSRLRKYLKEDDQLTIRNHHGVGFTLLEGSL
ncbi:MAG: response regulator transcription factor [Cyclobacteriaceae bacterium]